MVLRLLVVVKGRTEVVEPKVVSALAVGPSISVLLDCAVVTCL